MGRESDWWVANMLELGTMVPSPWLLSSCFVNEGVLMGYSAIHTKKNEKMMLILKAILGNLPIQMLFLSCFLLRKV